MKQRSIARRVVVQSRVTDAGFGGGGLLQIAGLAGCGWEGSAGAFAPAVSRSGEACARERAA